MVIALQQIFGTARKHTSSSKSKMQNSRSLKIVYLMQHCRGEYVASDIINYLRYTPSKPTRLNWIVFVEAENTDCDLQFKIEILSTYIDVVSSNQPQAKNKLE